MLQVRGLGKSYSSGGRRQQVFDQLALELGKGEVVALLGASGSGKTTLLNLISGIDTPDQGEVRLDSTLIHGLAEPQRTLLRRERIGFVFQFFNLIPTLTVAENVGLPLELLGCTQHEIQNRSHALLEAVGLVDAANRFPETLSGGEQQRVAVCRGLAHKPALLLADEPTGNLDEETGERVLQLLISLAREHAGTLLLVTHSVAVATAADRVLRLQHGRLVAA